MTGILPKVQREEDSEGIYILYSCWTSSILLCATLLILIAHETHQVTPCFDSSNNTKVRIPVRLWRTSITAFSFSLIPIHVAGVNFTLHH
ncbi:hypothetical protein BYT27DRAFT_7180244 [Phlegmacium glaucopus]|nr:hypothetical protein BYT27DRAFT_7180244 [Phlegmacium glaucopus]